MISLDDIKAFDNMRQNKLWDVRPIERRDVLKHLVYIIKRVYKNREVIVKAESGNVLLKR